MTILNPARGKQTFTWWVCSGYDVKNRKLHCIENGTYRSYRPSEIEDLPLAFVDVLKGTGAIRNFAKEYGLLGYRADLTFSTHEWQKLHEDPSELEDWLDERESHGEPLYWIRAHARNVLVLKHAHTFLTSQDPGKTLRWRSFVRGLGEDRLIAPGEKYVRFPDLSQITRRPERADSKSQSPPDEDDARGAIAILLRAGLHDGIRPTFKVRRDGSPEMQFQFNSLIEYIYWRLYEQMSSSFTRICPCGLFFQTDNASKIYHDTKCTNAMGQRRHREKVKLMSGGELEKTSTTKN